MVLAIPEQKFTKTPVTTVSKSIADQSGIVTAEHSVTHTLDKDTDPAQLQSCLESNYIVAIAGKV